MVSHLAKARFEELLQGEASNYAESFYPTLCLELGLGDEDGGVLGLFFESFENTQEIRRWVELVVSKIVLHEDETEPEELIEEYIWLQVHHSDCLYPRVK